MVSILSNRAIQALILRELREGDGLAEAALRHRLDDIDQTRITTEIRRLLAEAKIIRIGDRLMIPGRQEAEAA